MWSKAKIVQEEQTTNIVEWTKGLGIYRLSLLSSWLLVLLVSIMLICIDLINLKKESALYQQTLNKLNLNTSGSTVFSLDTAAAGEKGVMKDEKEEEAKKEGVLNK